MTKKTFKIPIYFGKLIVVVTDDLQKAANSLSLGFNAHGFAALACEKTTKKGLREYVILLGPNCDIKSVVHECSHITNYIMRFTGIEPDLSNDEPQCYLLGWVFGKAYSVWEEHTTKTNDNH